jgi:hypothetical protein
MPRAIEHYACEIIPALAQSKLHYWPHEGVNLHTREIRNPHSRILPSA